jgi:hypothetical protein
MNPTNPTNLVGDAADTIDTGDIGTDTGAIGNVGNTDSNAPAAVNANAAQDADPRVSGLSADANGNFYFALDGSGTPLEVRIDILMEEFENLYFDGALWSAGNDYAVRSGSTILTVAADRLERYDAGIHTLSAHFLAETVEIAFELIKGGATPETTAMGVPASGEDEGFPMPIAIAGIILLFGSGAAILVRKLHKNWTVK